MVDYNSSVLIILCKYLPHKNIFRLLSKYPSFPPQTDNRICKCISNITLYKFYK